MMPVSWAIRSSLRGGSFLNEAVLRAFEKVAGCEAVRPAQAGLMGAYRAGFAGPR